jgi:membrane peptidoglycan carboxypeptidase
VSQFRRLLRLLVIVLIGGALLAGTVIAVAPEVRAAVGANHSVAEQIDLAALDDYAVRSEVYASDGSLLTTWHAEQNRQPVPLAQMSQPLVESVLAVEDADFYLHRGVNARAVVRALTHNVSSGEIRQGGSTITQQLVKNALLSSERDIHRKSKEVVLAFRLEQELSKEQILEKYLNTVYFGAGAYGVEAAAETYWGLHASQLGYAEGAMLAAVIANPVGYDPTLHPPAAMKRRSFAIGRLVEQHSITESEALQFDHAPLPSRRCGADVAVKPVSCGDADVPEAQDYFTEQVKLQLLDDPRLGATRPERTAMLFGGGLRIYTTIDPGAQQSAEDARAAQLPANDKGITAAMVAIEPTTGAVRALVGGPPFGSQKFDIATQEPGRPTGSSFKVFTLLTAMEQGNLPSDFVAGGGSFVNPGGTPNPYTISGIGGTITSVTSASSNGAFVRLEQTVGPRNVIDMANRLGLSIPPTATEPTLTLGVEDSTPLQMASAYSAIPNGGIHQPAYFVERVEDSDGKVLLQHASDGTRAFSSVTACNVTQVLAQNVLGGTGKRAKLSRQDAGGKTGTTQNNTDAWFVGFTPYLVTSVWMGIPGGLQEMGAFGGYSEIFGGTIPALIWHDFNERYHQNREPIAFFPCASPGRSSRLVQGEGLLGHDGGSGPVSPSGSRSGGGGSKPDAGAGDAAGTTTTTGVSPPTSAPITPTTTSVPPPTTKPPKVTPPGTR